MTKTEARPTVRVAHVGRVPATPAGEVEEGDTMLAGYDCWETVTEVIRKSGNSKITTRDQMGSLWPVTKRNSTLVPIVKEVEIQRVMRAIADSRIERSPLTDAEWEVMNTAPDYRATQAMLRDDAVKAIEREIVCD